MGSVDDALPGGSSHLSTATVPSLSLRLLVFLPKGSRTCCTPWSVFQDGSDEAIRLPAATGAQVAPTGARSPPRLSTARSPHRTVHSRRGAPPYGVYHGGQGLPMFLGQHRSIVRQGCKLSMRDGPASTHLPLSPCRSGLTAAGPRSRGVRHGLGRPARDDLRRRVGALGRA